MGVLGTLFNYLSQTVKLQTNRQQFQQEFQQLGQDLQSGNLSAAQSDFATLQQDTPQSSSSSGSTSNTSTQNPIAQAFQQLSQDLKSGNLSAAQQDYSTIQQVSRIKAQSVRQCRATTITTEAAAIARAAPSTNCSAS